jgi:hypothetical protein
MSKRTKFVLVSTLIAFLLWLSTLAQVDYRFGLVLAIGASAYILSAWVLFDDLKGIEWITLLILPMMFTLGSGLFSNFLPTAFPGMFGRSFSVETSQLLAGLFRIFYFLLVGMGIYGVLLIENIFSVASIRTIQLFRAARSVNFILTLITSLFFFTVALSMKLAFWWVMPISFVVSFVLAYPSLWSVDLKNDFGPEVWRFAIASSWIVAIISGVLCFWPIKPFMGGLILTSALYAMFGVLEQRLSSRVYLESLLEYGVTVIIIIVVGFLTTSWLG